MAREDLSLFSIEILGLVGDHGAGAHDLLSMAKQGRALAWAGESQYYTEPKRLAKLGFLDARQEQGKTRERTVYTLTDQGRDALRAYAHTPARFTPLKNEALLRLLIADLVGEPAAYSGIAALRDDIDDLSARLREAEARAAELPHREKYLRHVTDFLRQYLQLHIQLIDNLELELADNA